MKNPYNATKRTIALIFLTGFGFLLLGIPLSKSLENTEPILLYSIGGVVIAASAAIALSINKLARNQAAWDMGHVPPKDDL